MKTLDEVIEKIQENVDDVNRGWDEEDCILSHDYMVGALHYLRNYRDSKAWLDLEKKNYAEAVKNCERAEVKYTKLVLDMNWNNPLTWDELKQMKGKPVWIEEQYSFCDEWHGYWEVISSFFDDDYADDPDSVLYMTDEEIRHKNSLGKTWQAYRKERGA